MVIGQHLKLAAGHRHTAQRSKVTGILHRGERSQAYCTEVKGVLYMKSQTFNVLINKFNCRNLRRGRPNHPVTGLNRVKMRARYEESSTTSLSSQISTGES